MYFRFLGCGLKSLALAIAAVMANVTFKLAFLWTLQVGGWGVLNADVRWNSISSKLLCWLLLESQDLAMGRN